MTLDPHGQPFNVRFNRARRAERDISEFLGLAKGLLADGEVTEAEAKLVAEWVATHQTAAEQWPMPQLIARLERIFRDQKVDESERRELAEILSSIVGGTAGVVLGEDAATQLPLDTPPPHFSWIDAVFVFTGKFAFGTRGDCQYQVTKLGALCEKDVTMRTRYLVIGTFGSRDWVHTAFGRKIQKAVKYREAGARIAIVAEDHWVKSIEAAV
jgi:NAD-dependent DNA ligase